MKKIFREVHSIDQIDIDQLVSAGKRCIITDLDNTLARWKTFIIKAEVKQWIDIALQKGFSICILSNNHNKERTQMIAEQLKISFCKTSKKKPSRDAYLEAARQINFDISECIMIGDQLFSDVKGAHKAGFDCILVDPIYKKEALITKVLRIAERFAGRKIIWQDE